MREKEKKELTGRSHSASYFPANPGGDAGKELEENMSQEATGKESDGVIPKERRGL